MKTIQELEINLDGMQESLQEIESLLNDIIFGENLSVDEIKARAKKCKDAVDRYTGISNSNVQLLNQQAQYLLKRVKEIQQNTAPGLMDPKDDPEYDIN